MNVRIIEVTRNETDWSALVSVDSGQDFAITFPLGARPTDAEITAAVIRQMERQTATVNVPDQADSIPIDKKVKIVSDLADNIIFPLTKKPTDDEIRDALEKDSAT